MAKSSGFQFIVGGYMFRSNRYSVGKYGRKKEFRWAEHNLIGREPVQQFIGEGVETISLSGTVYPQFHGRMYEMTAIKIIASLGRPVPVITGGGIYLGKFVITSVRDNYTELMDDHRARKNDFTIELKNYGRGFSLTKKLSKLLDQYL